MVDCCSVGTTLIWNPGQDIEVAMPVTRPSEAALALLRHVLEARDIRVDDSNREVCRELARRDQSPTEMPSGSSSSRISSSER
jgi:hypothetical protein